ncbi:MAG: hypothetical protein QM683_11215, partial [Lacrimispora sp.]
MIPSHVRLQPAGSGGLPYDPMTQTETVFCRDLSPKFSRWGSQGLMEVLASIQKLWKTEKDKVLEAGEEITGFLNRQAQAGADQKGEPAKELLYEAKDMLLKSFDERWGGFGRAPKFPMAHNLIFLLRHYGLERDKAALSAAEKTLKQMYRGGIYDHIGGGFSRYSTDEKWLVPHFEKMLYDNALLLYAYAEAFRMTGEELYARVSRGIIGYVLNVLTDENGGFYCGQDADSEGVEGKFYTFEKEEISRVLGEENAQGFCQWFGISEKGNFEGKNIPNLIENKEYEKENEKIDSLSQTLYDYRLKRMALHTDDKILTSWNGLMIAAIAKASRILGDDRILEAAKRAQSFIEKNLTNQDGRLY